ncbi:MAG: hypothetical protein KGD66_07740 [Candidatus Lokiarchaeota archaeon]|nr:hypothetical protein [Candidatus Lokiarchaeota archaeon]
MPIVDKSKLKRPEILENFEFRQNINNQVVEAFFNNVVYTMDDYKPIWKKVGELNERWLNGENVTNMLSLKEKLLLTEHLRFYMEYRADYMEKLSPIPKDAVRKPVRPIMYLANGFSTLDLVLNELEDLRNLFQKFFINSHQ